MNEDTNASTLVRTQGSTSNHNAKAIKKTSWVQKYKSTRGNKIKNQGGDKWRMHVLAGA